MLKSGLVVVIIGGSSGIGLATAQALAKRGANLVLAARHAPALEAAAEDCRALGAKAVLVRTLDMRDESAIAALGRSALERFGKIDVWMNCAALLGFGRFDEMPSEAFRLIVETNVIGVANGARTAIEIFRMQGCGQVINVGSMLGRVSEPLVSAYAASKAAIEGMTSVMQQELLDEKRIHVSLVLPWAIDTPIYQRAANFTGREVRTIWPIYGSDRAASAICSLIARPRNQTLIGSASYATALGNRLAHRVTLSLAGWVAPKMQVAPMKHGSEWGALRGDAGLHGTNGGWRAYWRKRLGRTLRMKG